MQINLKLYNTIETDNLTIYTAVAIGENKVQGVFQGDAAEIDAWVAREGYDVVEVVGVS